MAYNGNAREYWEQKQAQRQQELQRIWAWSVDQTEQANSKIADLAEEFKGIHSSNLDQQQQIDRQLAEHIDGLYDRMMGFQAETDRVHDDMQSIMDELADPFEVEVGADADRAQLERLYSEF